MAKIDPPVEGLARVLRDLGVRGGTKGQGIVKGAVRVFDIGHDIAKGNRPGQRLLRFEFPVDIPEMRTAKGRQRLRRYDLIVEEAIGEIRIEVKAWDLFPPFSRAQLDSALDAMMRDFVLHSAYPASNPIAGLRWLFPNVPAAQRAYLVERFALESANPRWARELRARGLSARAAAEAVDAFAARVRRGDLIRFAP